MAALMLCVSKFPNVLAKVFDLTPMSDSLILFAM